MRFTEAIKGIMKDKERAYERIHSKYGAECLCYHKGFVKVLRSGFYNRCEYLCPDMEDILADDWEKERRNR